MKHTLFQPVQLRGRMSRRGFLLASAVAFVGFVLIWGLVAYAEFVSPLFLPSPGSVLVATVDLFVNHGLSRDLLVSTYRISLGFLLSAALAIPLGLLIGTYKVFEALLEPLNDFIRYMPVVAFVPLTILWVGIGDVNKVLIVFIGTYFQLVLMVAAAASQTPRPLLETYYVLGGSHRHAILRVILPWAWPAIFDSLRIGAGWAWSYLVVAELVAAESGIGFKIMQALRFLRTDQMIGGIILVGLLGVATDYAFKLVGRRLFPWAQAAGAIA